MQEFSTVVDALLSGIFLGSLDPLFLQCFYCYNMYLSKTQ